jgi:uncharacterized membrane protein YeaQ/YmgE (transglycosylase-associated protein family)
MSLVASLILGLTAGFTGASVGGFLFRTFGAAPVTGIDLYSLIVAVIGLIVVLVVCDAVAARTRTVV